MKKYRILGLINLNFIHQDGINLLEIIKWKNKNYLMLENDVSFFLYYDVSV
jgi:hypothetical protein